MAKFSETSLLELTLRKYESPQNLTKRETLKKICLSIGLLQPQDSRDVIVDILMILENKKLKRREISTFEIRDEVIANRQKHNLNDIGTANSNIRRQLKRLRDIYLIEKVRNKYRICEFMTLLDIFNYKIKPILLDSILMRNNDFFKFYNQNYEKDLNEKKEVIIN